MSAGLSFHTSNIFAYDKGKMDHRGATFGRRIVAVAASVSHAGVKATTRLWSRAAAVFVHFHFIAPYNEKLDVLRRCVSGMNRSPCKEVPKATRWLLPESPENPEIHGNLLKRLQEVIAISELPATACYGNDDRKLFRHQPGKMAG